MDLVRELVIPHGKRLDASLPAAAAFLSKFGGKDKMIRIVQYGMRALRSLLTAEGMRWYYDKVQKLMVVTMEGRRTFRWFSFVAVVVQLRALLRGGARAAASPREWALQVLSKVCMVLWNLFDHLRWLQQISWAPTGGPMLGDAARSKRVSFSFFALANLANLAVSLPKWALCPRPSAGSGSTGTRTQRSACRAARSPR